MMFAALFLIKTYQIFLAPLQVLMPGAGCRFYPSCSEYTARCIRKHGLIMGICAGIKRVLMCNPWK